jgi:hypothetical protein
MGRAYPRAVPADWSQVDARLLQKGNGKDHSWPASRIARLFESTTTGCAAI